MPGLLALLIPVLIKEAPGLVASIIAILHKEGKITPKEVLDFVNSFDPEGGASFFKPKGGGV